MARTSASLVDRPAKAREKLLCNACFGRFTEPRETSPLRLCPYRIDKGFRIIITLD